MSGFFHNRNEDTYINSLKRANEMMMVEYKKLEEQSQKDRNLLKEFVKDMNRVYESEFGTDHIMAIISQHYNIIKRHLNRAQEQSDVHRK